MNLTNWQRPQWIPRWLNVPLIIFIVFIIVLLFFGDNNYIRINQYKAQINELKGQIKANEDTAALYNGKIRELNSDRETLERLAREKYGMKRINEEVYVTDIP